MKRREVGSIEIYADILFLVNFSMDFLALYLTGRVSGRPLRKRNLLAASAVGGAAGTALIVWRMPETLTVPAGLLLSVLLTRIAFGKARQLTRLLRDSLIVWGAGVLLGGIMTFLTSRGEPIPPAVAADDFPEAFALCFGIALLLARLLRTSRVRRSAVVTVEAAGIRVKLEALCDSGSFAAEPLSGLPVIPVRREALGLLAELADRLERTEQSDRTEQADQLDRTDHAVWAYRAEYAEHADQFDRSEQPEPRSREDCPLKLRLIPLSGIGGDSLLRGFVPDRLTVDGAETEAVVAVYDGSRFAGYDALLPAVLCGAGAKRTEHNIMKKTEEPSCSSEHPY